MKAQRRMNGMECCAQPIKNASNQPKMTSRVAHIANAVAMQPNAAGPSKIKGTVTSPKG